MQNIERNLKAQVKRFSQLIPEKTLKAQKVLSKKKLRTSRQCPEQMKFRSSQDTPQATRGFCMHGVHSNIIIPKYMNTFVIKWYRKMNSIVDVLIIEYRYFLCKLCTETVYKRREKKLIFCGKKKSFVTENFACGMHRHSPYRGGGGKYCHKQKMSQNPS